MTKIYTLEYTIYEKAVLWFLREFAEEHETLFPSYDTIAASCGMSRRKAISVIKKLVEDGVIEKEQRIKSNGKQTSNELRLCDALLLDKEKPSHAPYKSSSLKSLKLEEEEIIFSGSAVFESEILRYRIPKYIRTKILSQVPNLLVFSSDAIIRTFKKAMNRIRYGGGVYNLPKWFATTLCNEQFYLDQKELAG
jgi:hypothetical protein